MEIMTTTAVYHNKSMNLSGGNGSFLEGNEEYRDERTEVDKDELKKSLRIVSLTIYILVFVLGVLGNGVVIWVTGFKMKKTITTVWYLNLAVADFLFTAFLPLSITETAMDFHWPFGKFMCKLNFNVLHINMFASVYILMVISVDRCVCVVWPVWARNHRSVRKASCVSLGVWVLALAISSPYFIFKDTRPSFSDKDIIWCFDNFALTDDYSKPAVMQLWAFRSGAMIITRILMGFVVPFTVIVSCYSLIIYRLRRKRPLASHSGRPFRIIAVVITAFFVCWVPFHIIEQIKLVYLIDFSETLDNVINIWLPVAVSLAFINSCLIPLLYVFMGQDFKDVARKSILKAFTEELPQTNTSTNAGTTSQETALSEAQV